MIGWYLYAQFRVYYKIAKEPILMNKTTPTRPKSITSPLVGYTFEDPRIQGIFVSIEHIDMEAISLRLAKDGRGIILTAKDISRITAHFANPSEIG